MDKSKITKTVGWSVFYILALIILPPIIINALPEPILSYVKNSDTVNALLGSISYFGIALLVLSAIKNLSSPRSAVNFSISLFLIGVWIYFFYTVTSFGEFSSRTENRLTSVSFNLNPFLTLVIFIGILDAASATWGFVQARKTRPKPSA